MPAYRLWVNEDSTLLIRLWGDGTLEIARREQRGDSWGPPETLAEETIDD